VKEKRPEWSRIGFILAGIGSAVGIGNIWRFPYIVGISGGGAFLIPYLVAVVLFGMPLMMLEFAAGRKFRGSVITTLRAINSRLAHIGILPVAINIFILSYYLVITSWTLAFFLFSLSGYISFNEFVAQPYVVVLFLTVCVIVGLIVMLGIKRGIERTCKYLMPLLFLFLLVLVAKALSLPNALEGVAYYLTPHPEALMDSRIWLLAFGQAFFSLSVGFGILLTYGSYLRRDADIPKAVFAISLADTLIALIAGFIIFPLVFAFSFDPAAGPTLVFQILPQVFNTMPFGTVFGAMFFLLLFISAVTSAISMMEVGVASLIDEFSLTRRKAALILLAILIGAGMPSALSYTAFGFRVAGKPFLSMMDMVFGSLLTPLVAALLCISLAWFWKAEDVLEEVNANSRFKVPHVAVYLVRYVVPIVLILVFLLGVYSKVFGTG
jgi:NSS family neurotransmitter:Na+ symporter